MTESIRESARYQSREFPAGKPRLAGAAGLAFARGSSFALLGAFAFAAWANHWPLLFLTAAALMWRLPLRPLEPQPPQEATPPQQATKAALALPERPATIRLDSPFLVACWLLSTWALWQHRLLPLAVCIAALALALLDARERVDRSVF